MTYFDVPWLLPLAIVLPLLAIWLVRRGYKRRRLRLQKFGELDVVQRLVPPVALKPPRWRTGRLAVAGLLAGVAVAGPRWGEERSVVRSRGIDMVLALDASLSMMATDERPTRMERMKQEVRRLRAASRGDRMGLIAFAGRSYVLSPLTVDEGALDLFLDNLDPSVVGQAGSSIARTIRQGTDLLLLSNSGADRALVVMSDGEAFESADDVIAEAKRAGEQGVSLVTVGFGTTEGSTIPIKTSEGTTLKKDENGATVITKYHPELLKAAADAAGGTFIEAGATDKASRVKAALARLRTSARSTASGATKTPRFQLFLVPAMLLLLLDTMLSERRGARRRRAAAAETAAAAALLFSVSLSGCVRPGESEVAAKSYHAGKFAEAAASYRRAIDRGDKRPEMLYNYGTSLLSADSMQGAVEALDRVAGVTQPELRHRALFNLGLAHLKPGLAAAPGQGDEQLDAALAAYKKVLLLDPTDMDAKWNYELALRKKQHGGGGGGGGGGSNNAQQQEQQPKPSGGLGQSQADQLLGSAAREERDVQAKRQRQTRVEPPPGGKDW
jgi:Ca-activated chloride channel homolog